MKKMLLWLGVGLLTTHSVFSGGATSAGETSVEKVGSVWRDWGQIRDTEMADKIHQIIQERTRHRSRAGSRADRPDRDEDNSDDCGR